jgi:hypothetical protein
MQGTTYLCYLLGNLVGPPLVRWRWGLAAALTATVVELALVVPVFYVMEALGVFSNVLAGMPPPEHPLEMIRRTQLAGGMIYAMGVFAAGAALVGGGLAVAGSIVLAVWRAYANRTGQ